MYQVTYKTFAIMNDGSIGNNLIQYKTCYTNAKIENIETEINKYLKKDNEVCVITNIMLTNQSHVIEVKNEN